MKKYLVYFSLFILFLLIISSCKKANVPAAPAPTSTPTITGGGIGKILFESERDGNFEIYIMNADGSNQTRLTNNIVTDKNAKWSPDGSKILFESIRDGDN